MRDKVTKYLCPSPRTGDLIIIGTTPSTGVFIIIGTIRSTGVFGQSGSVVCIIGIVAIACGQTSAEIHNQTPIV